MPDTSIVPSDLDEIFDLRLPCDTAALGEDRGEQAHHGDASWQITLAPCLTRKHEQFHATVCTPCRDWLVAKLDTWHLGNRSWTGLCPRCGSVIDVRSEFRVRAL